MLPTEVINKVRRIEIRTRKLVSNVFAGEYRSTYRGRGIEFSEVREYQPGDDVRSIDWNVTARMGSAFVKIFHEERELTVVIIVDMSSSGEFGSIKRAKRELAIELSALLAFTAIRNNDRVGLLAFTDRIERYVPPKKGQKHGLRIISELVKLTPQGRKTDIRSALEFFMRVQRKKAVVFLLSDFLDEGYEKILRIANAKHDLVTISLSDPREFELPNVGLVWLEDAETNQPILLDTSDPLVRRQFISTAMSKNSSREKFFRSSDIDFVRISTDSDYIMPLTAFFRTRARRFR